MFGIGKLAAGFKWFGKKVGKGTAFVGKKIGKGAVDAVHRPEVQFIAHFLPGLPYLKTAIGLIVQFERKEGSGTARMRRILEILRAEPQFTQMKESELRWIIETALQVAEGRVIFQEKHYNDDGEA